MEPTPMSSIDATLSYAPNKLPSAPGVRAPKPLGLWPMFAWTTVGLVAALLMVVLTVLAGIAWNGARPAQALSEAQMTDVAQVAMCAGFLTFVGVIAMACRRAGWRAADYFGLTRPQGRYLLLGAIVLVVTFGVAIGLGYLGFSLADDDDIPKTITSLVVTLIALAGVAPIWEELIFRGFLYRTLAASRLGVAGAIVLSSLLWASLHVDKTWLGLVETFFCGLLYGWLRWRTGSTAVTMAVHCLNNTVVGVALTGLTLGWWA
jgi:membrane protease YdiL (CAAX protease family)